ncbi:hypothetical protein V2I01_36235 [Micromonospora sp. BRA006-A]|nr:hypothetical protein [Micromonospora sp. BRA006-A]
MPPTPLAMTTVWLANGEPAAAGVQPDEHPGQRPGRPGPGAVGGPDGGRSWSPWR